MKYKLPHWLYAAKAHLGKCKSPPSTRHVSQTFSLSPLFSGVAQRFRNRPNCFNSFFSLRFFACLRFNRFGLFRCAASILILLLLLAVLPACTSHSPKRAETSKEWNMTRSELPAQPPASATPAPATDTSPTVVPGTTDVIEEGGHYPIVLTTPLASKGSLPARRAKGRPRVPGDRAVGLHYYLGASLMTNVSRLALETPVPDEEIWVIARGSTPIGPRADASPGSGALLAKVEQ